MGRLKTPRILFVADFDGALVRTNTDTLIFQKLKPKMEDIYEAIRQRREENIRMIEKDDLLPLVKKVGGNVWTVLGTRQHHVAWDDIDPKLHAMHLSMKALQTQIGKKAIDYYPHAPVPAREVFMALMPSDEQIYEYAKKPADAWSAYEIFFSQFCGHKLPQLAFHEFIDAIFTKLFRYSDVVEASSQIAKDDIRPGVDRLFEILCSKGAHIAICSYSYTKTVKLVLEQFISKHIGYAQKTPFVERPIGTVVANYIHHMDLVDDIITGIEHVGNKWSALDAKLAQTAFFETDMYGRYPYSIAYEDDPSSLKDMHSRFPVSILLAKGNNRNRSAEDIIKASGLTYSNSRLEICREEDDGGVNGLSEIVKQTIKSMEKHARWHI